MRIAQLRRALMCCSRFVRLNPKTKIVITLLSAIIFLQITMYIFEGLSLWQSFYFSVITGTTVGYGDMSPKTVAGQVAVIIFALVTISTLGEFIAMTATKSMDVLNRARKGLNKVKDDVDLIIIGYPNQTKLQSIVNEYRNDEDMHKANIVCITCRIDEQPDWMVESDITFIQGIASSKEVLCRANIDNACKVIVLANNPEDIRSDDFTTSAVMMCKRLNPAVFTIAERVRQEDDMFKLCGCDCIVEVTTGRELAQESLNPGAIDLINGLLSTSTPATQRNFVLNKNLTWYGVATTLITKNATAVGYALKGSGFNFSPHMNDELLVGTVIKYISDKTIKGL